MKAQPSSVRMRPEETILSAWCEQVAQAAQTPAVRRQLLFGQPELLPKFAAQYQSLKALPRHARRGLQRKWKQSLAGVALLLALGQAPALAATINVGGGCRLVDAITAANTDNAIGLCTAGSGADTLVSRPGSTHTLTTINNSTPYGPTGLPVISSVITIAGNGSTITTEGAVPDFRILAVASTGNLTIRQTTVSGGAASGSMLAGAGGGVFNYGKLNLANSTVSRNSAALVGGGVFTRNSGAVAILTNSTVSGNSASGACGGVCTQNGTAILTNSTVSGNTASSGAGGVSQNGGALTLINSTVSLNAGGCGGGLNIFGYANITGSAISGNSAVLMGGGIYSNRIRVTLTNSTVSGNSTTGQGGGVFNLLGKMELINSTVSRNAADTQGGGVFSGGPVGSLKSDVVLTRTLISGNTATSGAEVFQVDGGAVNDDRTNVFGHSGLTNAQAFVGFTPGLSDSTAGTATSDGTRPAALASILNPALASNGGLTQTHALVAGSPAIDVVTTGCPLEKTDQRGVPRPQDGYKDGIAGCDIGAFELVPPGTVTCDGLPATKVGTSAAEAINGTPGPDVIQGLGGNDLIKGLAGNDVLCGGAGNDQVLGGMGDDRLFGEADKDKLNGEVGFDRCDGGSATGDTAANCEQVRNVP